MEGRARTTKPTGKRWVMALGAVVILALVLVPVKVFVLPEAGNLSIAYPFHGSVFPPGIIPPTVWWQDEGSDANKWRVTVTFESGAPVVQVEVDTLSWTPESELWEDIKSATVGHEARITVESLVSFAGLENTLSSDTVSISTSPDSVGAPIFYREVPLPFISAVENVSSIRWRLGSISSEETPQEVLSGLPVCGNCHSFSRDGRTLGMDVDVANDKGAYILTAFDEETIFARDKIFSWHDYRDDGPPVRTFGLLARVSPSGRYVVGGIRDRAVFLARPDLAYSQLFFPVQGALAVYDRETGEINALRGANDDRFVQTNATWTPDGRSITFARGDAPTLTTTPRDPGTSLTVTEAAELLGGEEYVEETKEGYHRFTYDLYTLPFNDGRGGVPVPVEGASGNGRSNYFPKYSPDGKWLVFNQAESFMLLMPDSKLYIMPAEGGEPRLMNCNTESMNSWHSWSPNGKWLVFSSKVFSPYTQLFLTHVDENGIDTPPVLLRNFITPERAANIPEFTNIDPGAHRTVFEMFVDDYNYLRRGMRLEEFGRYADATGQYLHALEMNPDNTDARYALGLVYANGGRFEEAEAEFNKVLERDPRHALALAGVAGIHASQRRFWVAIEEYQRAVEVSSGDDPDFEIAMHLNLGMCHFEMADYGAAAQALRSVLELDPDNVDAHLMLGNANLRLDDIEGAIREFEEVLRLDPTRTSLRERVSELMLRRGS